MAALALGLTAAGSAAELTAADEALLEEIEGASFRFFVEQAHPRTRLVRDRARADGAPSEGKASIAASGFALGGWVIAAERGWINRPTVLAEVRAMLRFLAREAPRRHGFFYHFMEMETGARAWQCEVSSIDTSLFLAGAIVAREYFADPEITALVNGLLADVDWAWFRNGGELVSLSWHDETGFSRFRWSRYSEHLLMSFLALGSSPRPVEAGYWARWERAPVGREGGLVYLQEAPLFVHQFPQAFIDFRDRRDAFADYFQNSRLATLAQRRFSLGLRGEFPHWGENLWGVTASDSATGYKAWGGPPRTTGGNAFDGTIVPCATAGSLPFAPEETLAVLRHLRSAEGDRIWKRYGFVDAFNPETGWVNPDVIGIDQGITLLQAENLRTGLIQRLFMQSPEAQQALRKAGLFSTRRTLDAGEQARVQERAARAWQRLAVAPASVGLQLTAFVAAGELGLLAPAAAESSAESWLAQAVVPAEAAARAQWAAALVVAGQAMPGLRAATAAGLAALEWSNDLRADASLGAADRLAVFFQVATGRLPAAAWDGQARRTEAVGPVQVLAPASLAGQVLPGLWLAEKAILPGASAAQAAYAVLAERAATAAPPAPGAMQLALLLEHFPREIAAQPGAWSGEASGSGDAGGEAALLITAANLLRDDVVRNHFQRDALVQTGRSAIAEFGEAAFGADNALRAWRELAVTPPPPPARHARAAPAATRREQWDWQTVAGLEFKDSGADVRLEDAPVTLRFAFTWDQEALNFHAEVTDTPTGFAVPAERRRLVELFVDPAGDGLVWGGAGDRQFGFGPREKAREFFHGAKVRGEIRTTEEGYTVAARIPWPALGVRPAPGLELGVSPAVLTQGTREWEPMLKLNWSYHHATENAARLGTLRLE